MDHSARSNPPAGPSPEGPLRPPRNEEPEFNAERDIPTEGEDQPADEHETRPGASPPPDPDAESVAGEEDPGAALDAGRSTPRR